jgi:hypothetical protein
MLDGINLIMLDRIDLIMLDRIDLNMLDRINLIMLDIINLIMLDRIASCVLSVYVWQDYVFLWKLSRTLKDHTHATKSIRRWFIQ